MRSLMLVLFFATINANADNVTLWWAITGKSPGLKEHSDSTFFYYPTAPKSIDSCVGQYANLQPIYQRVGWCIFNNYGNLKREHVIHEPVLYQIEMYDTFDIDTLWDIGYQTPFLFYRLTTTCYYKKIYNGEIQICKFRDRSLLQEGVLAVKFSNLRHTNKLKSKQDQMYNVLGQTLKCFDTKSNIFSSSSPWIIRKGRAGILLVP